LDKDGVLGERELEPAMEKEVSPLDQNKHMVLHLSVNLQTCTVVA